MNKRSKLSFFTLVGLICLVLATACSQPQSPTPTPSPTPSITPISAQEIVGKSSDKMQALNSYHFSLDQTGGGTPIAMGIEMKKAEGDILKPDKLKIAIAGSLATFSLQVQLVGVGGVIKMTNPLNGKWETLSDQFQILAVFDPTSGVAAILRGIASPARLEDEPSGGVSCYHVKGEIMSDSLKALTGSAASGVTISAELWIGKDDFLVRNIKLTGKITETEVPGIVRTLALSNFDQVLSIELPP